MSQQLFLFRGLRKDFSQEHILDLGDLAIYPGQCVLLSGENGSGKTTLLRIIAGLLHPDEGVVQYHQRWYSWGKIRRILQSQVIYVHQQPYLFDTTVTRNIEYGLRQMHMPSAARRARSIEALHWAGLEHLAERAARTLSSGEQQRVALTRARVLSPLLLLLDEPLANMDHEARALTCELIGQLRDEGVGILITGHEQSQLQPLADRLLLLENLRLRELTQENGVKVVPIHKEKYSNEH